MNTNWEKILVQERVRSSSVNYTEIVNRDQFQRDYDRCLFSTSVRRLQDKAQVFPLEPNDSVRTRLTHSLEVSNVARSIAEKVTEKLIDENKITEVQAKQIVIIAATCGLVHDLGNPPFGHSGEDAMREWYKSKFKDFNAFEGKRDFEEFEGNAQTLRLLTKLQMAGDLSGLNLTYGTLSASRKYISDCLSINKSKQSYKKLGSFCSEKELIRKIEEKTGVSECRNPITYIVEAADDIVYSIVDIEDGIKKGVLNWKLLKNEFKAIACSSIEGAEKNIYTRAKSEKFNLIDSAIDTAESAEFEELNGSALDQARMTILRTDFIGININSVIDIFLEKYDDIMKGDYCGELVSDCKTHEIIKKCKGIATKYIFPSEKIVRLEVMGKHVIQDLMNIFWEGIKDAPYELKDRGFNKKIYNLISVNYRTVFEYQVKYGNLGKEYYRFQLLGDYICGMTDGFACQLHRELKNG